MDFAFTSEQLLLKKELEEFIQLNVMPNIEKFEREGAITKDFINELATNNLLGTNIKKIYGGKELESISLGLFHEEFGKAYGSLQNLLTVYGMVTEAIQRGAKNDLKEYWIKEIIRGNKVPAFALTEPEVGSNIKEITTEIKEEEDHFIINGKKKWITLAQIADIFLVFGKTNNMFSCVLVERETKGFNIEPIDGLLGLKANMVAELTFTNCKVPKENLVGTIGNGISSIASISLDQGRYTTAWGSVGLMQACLDSSLRYTKKRKQFGKALRNFELIQKMITEMIAKVHSARLVSLHAGYLRNEGDTESVSKTLLAKYVASTELNEIATNAVQVQGAQGCCVGNDAERYFRDAKIMEIIEGTTQMHEILISTNEYFNFKQKS